jgi:hypothetical protein
LRELRSLRRLIVESRQDQVDDFRKSKWRFLKLVSYLSERGQTIELRGLGARRQKASFNNVLTMPVLENCPGKDGGGRKESGDILSPRRLNQLVQET